MLGSVKVGKVKQSVAFMVRLKNEGSRSIAPRSLHSTP